MKVSVVFRGAAFFLSAIALSACKPEVVADLYIGDIYEAYQTGQSVKTPISITIPIQSADECQDSQDKILPILNKYSETEVRFRSCEDISDQMYDAMIVETDVDIVSADREGGASFSGLGAILMGKKYANVDAYETFFVLNQNFGSMVAEIDEAFRFQSVKIDSIDLRININNDTRSLAQLVSFGFFINDEPIVESQPYALDRRDELRMVSSDVVSAHLARKGYVQFGWIAAEGADLPESWRVIPGLFNDQPWSPSQ